MFNLPSLAVAGSIVALLFLAVWRFFPTRKWRSLILAASSLLATAWVLRTFLFQAGDLTARGTDTNQNGFIAGLYLSMVFGMLANYLYQIFSKEKSGRAGIDFGLLFAPVFVSPIVFIPLFSAFQNANFDDKQRNVAHLSLLFVAFQNGFFWKDFFDNRKKQTHDTNTPLPVHA